ncbi:TetR/AcrR family transcriptional regulator [Streptomyces sp. NPDC007172]|uniref:TetR/AcrR family transcriptional regulator n=1 Tax=Streptomyces sp. NPDC007172 TaxID=3364776 RepID=UPI0036CFFAA7
MARPRQFDEERALDAAMRAFWANGYEATSTQDLCEATGLGRSSIYNTFTSKHALFERALGRYVDMMTATQLDLLQNERLGPLDRIRALFATVVDGEMAERRDGRSIGCLSVNATVELARRDARAAALLERDLTRRLDALRTVLATGQSCGEVTSRRDPLTLARYLNSVIAGLRVAGQGGADRADLEAVVDTALDALTV